MSLASKRFKVYVQVTLVVTVIIAVLTVLVMNRHHAVKFWFFGLTDAAKEFNVIWLVLAVAVATRIVWWVMSFTWGLWRDMREIKRLAALEQAEKSNAARAAAMDERERILDRKIQVESGMHAATSGTERVGSTSIEGD